MLYSISNILEKNFTAATVHTNVEQKWKLKDVLYIGCYETVVILLLQKNISLTLLYLKKKSLFKACQWDKDRNGLHAPFALSLRQSALSRIC